MRVAWVVAVVAVTGCQHPPGVEQRPSATRSGPSVKVAQSSPAPSSGPLRTVEVGGVAVQIAAGSTVTVAADGTATIVSPVAAGVVPRVGLPEGAFDLVWGRIRLRDGSFLTRPTALGDDGRITVAPFVVDGAGATMPSASGAESVTFLAGTRLVASSRWESESRILITPTRLARDLAPGDILAAEALAPEVMAQVIAQQGPRAADLGTATAENQLACHMIGARNKETWNLELDRTDKGLAGFIGSRCN